MELNSFEEKKVKNTIRRMSKVLQFTFRGKNDLYIGFYALMTAQLMLKRYFDEDCNDPAEFRSVKPCILKNLSEFTKTIYGIEFKKKEGK